MDAAAACSAAQWEFLQEALQRGVRSGRAEQLVLAHPPIFPPCVEHHLPLLIADADVRLVRGRLF